MSYSKRILFGDDPADDHVREQIARSAEQYLAAFQYKVPTRRKNRLKAGPYWDADWCSIVEEAAKALGIESVQINDQRCYKTQQDANAVEALAEQNHQTRLKDREALIASWKVKP